MKPPAACLVVDTSIILSALLGSGIKYFQNLPEHISLYTTERAVAEAHRRVQLGMKRPDLLPGLMGLLESIEIVSTSDLEAHQENASLALRLAVPSRNGSTRDAHILSLAWSLDADIWSSDRDFAGTGVASWSTGNLFRAFAQT